MDEARFGHVPGHVQVEVAIEEECLKRLHSVKGSKVTNLVRTKRKLNLIVRLIGIKYNKRLLCYLSSYINLLMSDLRLDLDLWSRDDISLSSRLLLTQCPLINHALLSDHSLASVRIQLAGSSRVTSRSSILTLLPQDIAM